MTTGNDLHHQVATVLRIGFRTAGALLVIGLAIALIRQESLATEADRFADIPGAIGDLKARGFIDLAIIAIVLTPIAAVVTIWRGFRARGESRFARYTLGVAAVLSASVLLALFR